MKIRKLIWIVVISLVGLIVFSAVAVWLLTGASPSAYKPMLLSQDQRREAAREFFYARILEEFNNKVQLNDPFTWSVSQDEINSWLASMPEIAQIIPGGDPKRIYDSMDASGIGELSASIEPGKMTLMARQKDYNKIISIDLSMQTLPGGRLNVKLLGTRIGVIGVPDSVFRSRLNDLKSQMKQISQVESSAVQESSGGLSGKHVGRTLAALIAAIDEEPVDTEIRWPLAMGAQKFFRVDSVEFRKGGIDFRIQPTRRPGQEK